jgi:hypothetical protein
VAARRIDGDVHGHGNRNLLDLRLAVLDHPTVLHHDRRWHGSVPRSVFDDRRGDRLDPPLAAAANHGDHHPVAHTGILEGLQRLRIGGVDASIHFNQRHQHVVCEPCAGELDNVADGDGLGRLGRGGQRGHHDDNH